MKKIIFLTVAAGLALGTLNLESKSAPRTPPTPAKQSAKAADKRSAPAVEQPQPSQAEQEAYTRVLEKLIKRYEDLGVHDLITEALQEIADENREDFEVVLKYSGIDDPTNPGTTVLPFGPIYFRVQ